MSKYIRHINDSEVLTLGGQVDYLPGQIVSKTLAQNSSVSLTLFAFDKNEEISSHDSSGDAMITVLDGTGEVTIDGAKYSVQSGETIIMPAKIPHAVYAPDKFKMLLTVIFPKID